MLYQSGSYSEGFFTEDMFAVVQHEDGGVLMGRVHIGHIYNVHFTVPGQLLVASPCLLYSCASNRTEQSQRMVLQYKQHSTGDSKSEAITALLSKSWCYVRERRPSDTL